VDLREALRSISEDDIRILKTLEKYMRNYEFVPIELIEHDSRLPLHRLERSLHKLNSMKLIKRQSLHTLGYRLTILAFDILAVLTLIKKGTIKDIGDKIGVGKESDVYLAVSLSGRFLTLKFHRIGRTSFRHVVRTRPYKQEPTWLLQSKISAQREFMALKELFDVGAKVPKPVDRSRHVVVTEYIEDTVELHEKPSLSDPLKAFEDVIMTIAKAYNDVGIVHGDLSEYNIIVNPQTSEAYVIDWPQYIEKDHPLAEKLLRRDVEYVVKFFRKVYKIPVETEEVLGAIRG